MAGAADERHTLAVLVGAGRLANEHNLRARVAVAKDEPGRGRLQAAAVEARKFFAQIAEVLGGGGVPRGRDGLGGDRGRMQHATAAGFDRLRPRGGEAARFRAEANAGAAFGEAVMRNVIDGDIDAHVRVPAEQSGQTFRHHQNPRNARENSESLPGGVPAEGP